MVFVMMLMSCKKHEWKGVYSGIETYQAVSAMDTVNSSFQQTVTVDFKGTKCHFNSQTLIWEFKSKEKHKTGYTYDDGNTTFEISFEQDSLFARYSTTELDQLISRNFSGKK